MDEKNKNKIYICCNCYFCKFQMATVDWELGGIKLAMTIAIFLVGIVFGLCPILTRKIKPDIRTRGKLFHLKTVVHQ